MPFLIRTHTIILLLATLSLLSFRDHEKTGKELFDKNCSACHKPNSLLTGPPFQNIRSDYGLDWTIKFIKDNESLLKQKDSKALYIFYRYNNSVQPKYDNLSDSDIIKILDYVDSFPIENSGYSHRKLTEKKRQKYINDCEAAEKKRRDDFEKSIMENKTDSSRNHSGHSAYAE